MKTALEKVSLNTDKIRIVMPDEVLNKINTLCTIISEVEWSGILLYTTRGSIKNPKKMVITLKDIILMNKGTSVYTEYNFNEKKRDQSGYSDRHIDYTNEFEEALEWQIGHIHSHNKMGVFFSGTDMEELADNSPSHNLYLSLIVNNKLDFTAKVSFIARAEAQAKTSYQALDENGNPYTLSETILSSFKEKLFIYDCSIKSNKDKIEPNNFFMNNIKEVLATSDTPKPVSYSGTTYKGYTPGNSNNALGGSWDNKKTPDPVYSKQQQNFYSQGANYVPKGTVIADMFRDDELEDDNYTEEDYIKDELKYIPRDVEMFGMRLLGVEEDSESKTFEDACIVISNSVGLNESFLKDSILTNLNAEYERHFGETGKDESVFMEVMDSTIALFEIYEEKYPILTNSAVGLRVVLDKFLETIDDGTTI